MPVSMSNTEQRNITNAVSTALQKASEYDRLCEKLRAIPEFEERRTCKLAADQEECYGIWGGGDYTVETIVEIVQKWAAGEETEASKKIRDLENIILDLNHKNRRLEAENTEIASSITRAMSHIRLRSGTESRFNDIINTWIMKAASDIEIARAKEKDDTPSVVLRKR